MSETIVFCPECAKGKSAKLYINVEMGVFNCFRCGFKGKLKQLHRYPELIAKLEVLMDLAEYAKLKSFKPLDTRNIDLLEELNPVREVLYDDPQYSYLLSRGWNENLINIYRPLVSLNPAYSDRVIIPVIENDKIIYYTARSILADATLRYKNPGKVSKKTIVFKSKVPESVLYPDDIVIAEGIFDSFKIPNAIGLLGKVLSEENEPQLLSLCANKQNIYICLDAGAETAISLLCKKLYSWFPSKSIFCIDTSKYQGSDLGDLSRDLSSIELLNWIRENSLRYVPNTLSSGLRNRIFSLAI